MTITIISNEDELDAIKSVSQVVILDVFAPWCGPCKAIAPYFEQLAKTHSSSDVKFCKFDCTTDRDLAESLGVSSIPTFIVFEFGELKEVVTGGNKENLRNMVDRYVH
jgi:thioredoxin 1